MGVSSPRPRLSQKKKVLFAKRSSSSRDALTPRTLERRTIQKESVANLFAELNLTPGPFSLHNVKAEQKDWKVRATAIQSPQIRRLCRNLRKRKQLMKTFTQNNVFADVFKRTGRSKEEEEQRFSLETALSYSPVELVARNLIDKAANADRRDRHGVWSQLGKPYSCLGVPASSIPKRHRNPRGMGHFDAAEEVSPFFQITSKFTRIHEFPMVGSMPVLRKKSELLLKESQADSKLQCFLIKMGLSHLHDKAHTKFPKKLLDSSDHLRKTVRVKTPFSQSLSEKNTFFQSTGRLSQQATQLVDFRALPFPISMSSSTEDDPNAASGTKDTSPGNQAVQSLVFEWMKEFLILRKGLQENLKSKLVTQAIRGERCRSCPPFSAEVSAKLLMHMQESCSRQTPILTQHIWKLAEESVIGKRVASVPLVPEVESISNFYEKVCSFVNNQRDDDPLMEVLVRRLKELLESGFKLQKELLSSLCYYMGHLPENIICTGRMMSVMPILQFISKELRVPSTDYYALLRNSGLDRFHNMSKNPTTSTPNQ